MSREVARDVKILTAFLLSFPEISKVELDGKNQTLTWSIFFHYRIPEQERAEFIREAKDKLKLFFKIRKVDPKVFNIRPVALMDKVHELSKKMNLGANELEMISWTRDYGTLTLEELACHHSIVREQFLGRLVQGDTLPEQEQERERSLLHEGLDLWRYTFLKEVHLVGVRDDFQVSVYEYDQG